MPAAPQVAVVNVLERVLVNSHFISKTDAGSALNAPRCGVGCATRTFEFALQHGTRHSASVTKFASLVVITTELGTRRSRGRDKSRVWV